MQQNVGTGRVWNLKERQHGSDYPSEGMRKDEWIQKLI
jgi:hypothetical protein